MLRKRDFQTNVPVPLSFGALIGEAAESQFGDETAFETSRGKMYVPKDVGDIISNQLHNMGVTPGELVQVAKTEVMVPGRTKPSIRWKVTRPAVEGNGNGNPGAGVSAPAPGSTAATQPHQNNGNGSNNGHANGNGHSNGHAASAPSAPAIEGWAAKLLTTTNALTDVFAAALQHSSKHGQLVKAEDVRNLLTTAFIGQQKNGGSGNGQ